MAANLNLFCMHLHRQPNAIKKLDLQSPIVNHDYQNRKVKVEYFTVHVPGFPNFSPTGQGTPQILMGLRAPKTKKN